MEARTLPDTQSILSDQQHIALWERIENRLNQGDVLITADHFQQAVEEEYLDLAGSEATANLKTLFALAIESFNRSHPQTYLNRGVENGVVRAFHSGALQLQWPIEQVKNLGEQVIGNFTRRSLIRVFLKTVGVDPDQINTRRCIEKVAIALPEPGTPLAEANQTPLADRERQNRVRRTANSFRQQELRKLPQRITNLVQRGQLSRDESNLILNLETIEQQVGLGDIAAAQGQSMRLSLASAEELEALEQKLNTIVQFPAFYLTIVAALKRISQRYDQALEFVIRHRLLTAQARHLDPTANRRRLAQALAELNARPGLTDQLIALMEGNDREFLALAEDRLPYRLIPEQNRRRIAPDKLGDDFVERLRQLDLETLSDQLNNPDRKTRQGTADEIVTFVSALQYMTRPTLLRQEIRLLRLQRMVESVFAANSDGAEARLQALDILTSYPPRLFPDLTANERLAIQDRRQHILEAADGRQNASRDPFDLTNAEERQGAQVVRVQIPVGGRDHHLPYRIIPDPERPDTYLLATRDQASGKLVPLLRQGRKRPVHRHRDGIWHPQRQ